jgi:hypothetical protein
MLGLSTVSLALCGAVVVEPRAGHTEHPPIWSVVLLPPGERKSATQAEIERPVREWCRDKTGELGPRISLQQQRRARDEKRLERLMSDAVKAEAGGNAGAWEEAQA